MPVNGGPIDEALWDAYLATVVTIDGRPAAEVAVGAVDGDGSWWVLTAHNPFSGELSVGENDRRHEALCRRLDADGLVWRSAFGTSPDGTWSEESIAVTGIDRDVARAYGREFGQHAVFDVADGILRVHACFDDRTAERPL